MIPNCNDRFFKDRKEILRSSRTTYLDVRSLVIDTKSIDRKNTKRPTIKEMLEKF